jgi:hypothetical protein
MPRWLRPFYLMPLPALFIGCAGDSEDPVARSEASAPRIILRLRTRENVITACAGADGPRYAIATAEGKEIEAGLSLEELEARHPSIYDAVRSSMVEVDASLWGRASPVDDDRR